MRWLKSLVIVLGILIVLGVLLLGFGFYKKTTDPEWRLFGEKTPPVTEQQSPNPPTQERQRETLEPFGTLSLNLPAGCVITEVTPQRRVTLLKIGPTAACNAVIAVDVRKGVVLGTIKPQP